MLLADWLQRRGLPGRITILDPNLPAIAFDRIFRESYRERILYLPQSGIREIDLGRKRVVSDFDTVDFTAAILLPPQRAAVIPRPEPDTGSGLVAGRTAEPAIARRRASVRRRRCHRPGLDTVRALPENRPDRPSARARSRPARSRRGSPDGRAASELPDSTCIVIQRAEPLEMTRIDTHYRRRGDGEIMQTVKQQRLAQAGDDDLAWAHGMFGELGL